MIFKNIKELKDYARDNDISNIKVVLRECTDEDIYNNLDIFKKITQLNINYTCVTKLPKELVNLNELDCSVTHIKEIPKEYINLEYLNCSRTKVSRISKECVNIKELDCSWTKVSKIPKELVNISRLNCYNSNIKFTMC